MTALSFDDIAPEKGDYANSYEQFLQYYDGPNADLDAGGTPVDTNWKTIPEITALDPKFTATVKDIQNYAYKGTPGHSKTGDAATITVQVYKKRVPGTGDFYPWYLRLKQAADAKGEANKVWIRWGDALGASEAYQAKVLVAHPSRQNTGDDDIEVASFELTSDGSPTPITNPFSTPTPEVVQVAITGTASVEVGSTTQLTATATNDDQSTTNVTDTAVWVSSDTTKATVVKGKVSGVAAGTVQVHASAGGVTSIDTAVTVTAAG